MFRLHRIARSFTAMFTDLLLACHLADAACAVMNVVTALIFIILIVSWSHAFFLVVPVGSFLHVLVVFAVISYFQQNLPQPGWSNRLLSSTHVAHVTGSSAPTMANGAGGCHDWIEKAL